MSYAPLPCPAPPRVQGNSIIGLISSEIEPAKVQSFLHESDWIFRPVRTIKETMRSLAKCHSSLVICEMRFSDGDWRDLLAQLSALDSSPNLVLLAQHDVALVAELLNLGGYDLLEMPLKRSECLHVFASAHRNWHARRYSNTSSFYSA